MATPASHPGNTHWEDRRFRGLDSPAAILAAATRLFVQSGYASVSPVDIAREVGTALPAVQAITGGKSALLGKRLNLLRRGLVLWVWRGMSVRRRLSVSITAA
ncbi:TetR family transcriptional regulator [Streptomyces sp. NPDC057557]|uniref:TetR family transcriptional regulator n=1 Tax=Streptomyces sp. NPDC057557 TaxID=3346167 RepID=UPI00368AC01F